MHIIPSVDVLDGAVVRLERGDFDRVTTYADDPVAQAQAFVAQGAALVHVVDLAGARDGSTDPELWRRLGGAAVPFQVGGGIRTLEAATAATEAGATRVVVGTAAVWDPDAVASMVSALGAERIVGALDVAGERATGAGWLDEGKPLADTVATLVDAGVVRALVTGISRDGTMEGPDTGLLEAVASLAPDMALIASGGVGSLADLSMLAATSAEAAIVGRAIYEGRFTVAEAVAALRRP